MIVLWIFENKKNWYVAHLTSLSNSNSNRERGSILLFAQHCYLLFTSMSVIVMTLKNKVLWNYFNGDNTFKIGLCK